MIKQNFSVVRELITKLLGMTSKDINIMPFETVEVMYSMAYLKAHKHAEDYVECWFVGEYGKDCDGSYTSGRIDGFLCYVDAMERFIEASEASDGLTYGVLNLAEAIQYCDDHADDKGKPRLPDLKEIQSAYRFKEDLKRIEQYFGLDEIHLNEFKKAVVSVYRSGSDYNAVNVLQTFKGNEDFMNMVADLKIKDYYNMSDLEVQALVDLADDVQTARMEEAYLDSMGHYN